MRAARSAIRPTALQLATLILGLGVVVAPSTLRVSVVGPTPTGGSAKVGAARAAVLAASFGQAATALSPAYYRAIIIDRKAFPVARSNFLSYLEFPDSWHAPRLRLVGGTWKLIGVHEGIDIMAERGTPVLAMAPGVVENSGWTFYSGTRIGVRGNDGRYYLYAHLSSIEPGVIVGAAVAAGDVLGRVGNTGYGLPDHRDEFPPHLHFGIEVGAEWVNPYPSLVDLYRTTVRETARAQRRLDDLAAQGRTEAFDRTAARTFLSQLPPGLPGE